MDEWDDKETGKKRSKIKVRADRVVFLTFKDGVKSEGDGERTRGMRLRLGRRQWFEILHSTKTLYSKGQDEYFSRHTAHYRR